MEEDKLIKGLAMFLLATIVLAITISFKNNVLIFSALASFAVVLAVNILSKKAVGHLFEINVRHKFWSVYQWGFAKRSHFKKAIPMIWIPLVFALLTKGIVWWLAILEFDVQPKKERVSRRHGLYRFTQVTEWHMALIAFWGIVATVLAAVIGYVAGFELFAKLAIYYAAWSIIPLSSLDGSKLLFGSRILWIITLAGILIFTGWAILIPL